jgi:hypothetical protein
LNRARTILWTVLLIGGTELMQASVIETLTINLSPINPGSILSGSVTLAAPIPLDGSAPIPLSFNDPADYSFTSPLITTLSVALGTTGDTERFSTLVFTNAANSSTIDLMVEAPAQCAVGPSSPLGVPCQATGLWQDQSPALFTGQYFISAINIPEPGSGSLLAFLGMSLILARYFIRRKS